MSPLTVPQSCSLLLASILNVISACRGFTVPNATALHGSGSFLVDPSDAHRACASPFQGFSTVVKAIWYLYCSSP